MVGARVARARALAVVRPGARRDRDQCPRPRSAAAAGRPCAGLRARAANLEAQWFALRFARAYMTFTADPAVRERALAPFIASGGDPDAGATPAGGQRVAWAQIAAERDLGAQRDYTVALATGSGALRYLVVALTPAPGGGETLAHYPALVGGAGPRPGRSARRRGTSPTLPAGALATVIDRALRNYLAGSDGEPRGRPRRRRHRRPGGAGPSDPGSAATRRPAHGSRARHAARIRSCGRSAHARLPRRRAPGRRPVGGHEHRTMTTDQGGPG